MHPIFCAHLIILLGVLNLDIIMSTPPLECLNCLFVCKLNKFHSFIFKLCIMIVHTLKMCTRGPEQSLVLFIQWLVVGSVVTNFGCNQVVLCFKNFTKEDGGIYKVTAKNDSGEGTANITINLEGYV